MIHKIKDLIDEGYTIEFKPYEDKETLCIILSKDYVYVKYILTYLDLQNSILDPDVVICQILDYMKKQF